MEIHEFYAQSLRTGLFSGFISSGAFLLSMKTFIVLQMKKEVYDRDEYRKDHAEKDGCALYRPLKRLSRALFFGILSCIVASLSQFTIGLIPSNYAAISCMTLALLAAGMLVFCLILTFLNIGRMIEVGEADWDTKRPSTPRPSSATRSPETQG